MKKRYLKLVCLCLAIIATWIGIIYFSDIHKDKINCSYKIDEQVTLVSEFGLFKKEKGESERIGVISFKLGEKLYGVGHFSDLDKNSEYFVYKTVPAFIRSSEEKLGFVLENKCYPNDELLGKVVKDSDDGVLLTSDGLKEQNYQKIDIANEIVSGNAQLIMKDNEDNLQTYSVYVDIIRNKGKDRLDITITDENLISKTNGILSGMSGSPIIQNGKLIGVVKATYLGEYKGIGKIIWDIDCVKEYISKN